MTTKRIYLVTDKATKKQRLVRASHPAPAPLTDEQRWEIARSWRGYELDGPLTHYCMAAVERAHGIQAPAAAPAACERGDNIKELAARRKVITTKLIDTIAPYCKSDSRDLAHAAIEKVMAAFQAPATEGEGAAP